MKDGCRRGKSSRVVPCAWMSLLIASFSSIHVCASFAFVPSITSSMKTMSRSRYKNHNKGPRNASWRSSPASTTPSLSVTSSPIVEEEEEEEALSIEEATDILVEFDKRQLLFSKEENVGLGGGISATKFVNSELTPFEIDIMRDAVLVLCRAANRERGEDSSTGQVMMGICAGSTTDALAALKSWVTGLSLPRGLLHGMDVKGVPIDPAELGAVFVKYNTGGTLTFSQMRKSGLGFDALWKPGDALLEPYDGDFRGVYFTAELQDGQFRQYGLLPLNLFG